MAAIEKLQLFAIAARPVFEDFAFFLRCLLGLVIVGSCGALYAVWSTKLSFGGKSAREAAIRAHLDSTNKNGS